MELHYECRYSTLKVVANAGQDCLENLQYSNKELATILTNCFRGRDLPGLFGVSNKVPWCFVSPHLPGTGAQSDLPIR